MDFVLLFASEYVFSSCTTKHISPRFSKYKIY